MRYDSLNAFVVVTLRNDSYASVCCSSLNVNQSLQFAFIRLEISDSIATIRNYSQRFVMGSSSIS